MEEKNGNVCEFCLKTFKSLRGVKTHYPSCKAREGTNSQITKTAELTGRELISQQDIIIHSQAEAVIEGETTIQPPESRAADVEHS